MVPVRQGAGAVQGRWVAAGPALEDPQAGALLLARRAVIVVVGTQP
jgi:hypothetical protein